MTTGISYQDLIVLQLEKEMVLTDLPLYLFQQNQLQNCLPHLVVDWLLHLVVDWLLHLVVDWLLHLVVDWLPHLVVDWLLHQVHRQTVLPDLPDLALRVSS